jgi:hypothetical protein
MDGYQFKEKVDKLIKELERESEEKSKLAQDNRDSNDKYWSGYYEGARSGLFTAVERLKTFSTSLPDIRADHDL